MAPLQPEYRPKTGAVGSARPNNGSRGVWNRVRRALVRTPDAHRDLNKCPLFGTHLQSAYGRNGRLGERPKPAGSSRSAFCPLAGITPHLFAPPSPACITARM